MRICLLSYDCPHRKTAQVFLGLWNRGIGGIDFLLTPFTARPERQVEFAHRPPQFVGPSPRALARLNGGAVHEYSSWREIVPVYDHFIVCGSNLLEPEFANSGKILNVHAGLIPSVRGLDSFKWAVHANLPLGNTLHTIDENADAGVPIARVMTPVFMDDTIESLAHRHYENEIWMLGNFDRVGDSPQLPQLEVRKPTMRMPRATEVEMLARFESYKHAHALDR